LERLSGWATYAQLAEAAAWLQEWHRRPPISVNLPGEPADAGSLQLPPGDACQPEAAAAGEAGGEPVRAAMEDRLWRVEARVERQSHPVFGFRSYEDWVAQVVPRLVASELAVATGRAPAAAQAMVDAADVVFLQDRLPRLRRLLAAGWVEWPKVRLFVQETATLDAEVARAVEAVVLGPLPGADELAGVEVVDVLADPAAPGSGVPVIARWTLPQLKAALRAAVLELDAAAAERRARQARRGRHVRAAANDDGTADMVANLPAEDAAAVLSALTAAARAAKAAGDPRTLDQLRADELVHRATRGVATTESPEPEKPAHDPHDTGHDEPGDGPGAGPCDAPGDEVGDGPGGDSIDAEHCACGRRVPVRHVPSFTAELAGPATKSTLVSLTIPLSTFLGIADQPGQLDGHGPVAAGLARRIAADAAQDQPAWTAWRCIVTDDVHGTVLGVTDPIWTPRHDPPERLTRLVTAITPTCVFPGCRAPARRCDLDHRIPYDPDDPTGDHGGGRTCSCNLQALCRGHHHQKTSGALRVRAVTDDPAAPAGTLEWTLPSGVTCRTHPHVAAPAPLTTPDPRRPLAPDVRADIDTAVHHLTEQRARHDERRRSERSAAPAGGRQAGTDTDTDTDPTDEAWRQSRADAAARRAHHDAAERETARLADEPCPF
jgi:hypothetical protein